MDQVEKTLRSLGKCITADAAGGWATAGPKVLDRVNRLADQLLDLTASDTATQRAILDLGGRDLLLKVLSEANGGDAADADLQSSLERVRERCVSSLANLARTPDVAAALVGYAPCVDLVIFTLLNEADTRVLQAAVRFLQTAFTILAADPGALIDLISAVLDSNAIEHLFFIINNTLAPALFNDAVALVTTVLWMFHRRLALDAGEGADPDFPFVPRTEVEGVVAYLVAVLQRGVLGQDGAVTAAPGAEVSWQVAATVAKCLGTMALIGPAWQLLLDPHAPALYRTFAALWPSISRDPDLEPLAGYWLRIVSQLNPAGWSVVVKAIADADAPSADKLAETAVLHSLPALVRAAAPWVTRATVRRLQAEYPDALQALEAAAPKVHGELMARAGVVA
ncbi:hypothetical protein H9P43_004187 [Blastocladiella emersonii ATCC 22665]|nr:hypothetical protein H9P43_004187 [Blastocladiella emersonii ATCC 22665]